MLAPRHIGFITFFLVDFNFVKRFPCSFFRQYFSYGMQQEIKGIKILNMAIKAQQYNNHTILENSRAKRSAIHLFQFLTLESDISGLLIRKEINEVILSTLVKFSRNDMPSILPILSTRARVSYRILRLTTGVVNEPENLPY